MPRHFAARVANHKPVRNDRETRTCTIRLLLIPPDGKATNLSVSINDRKFSVKVPAVSEATVKEHRDIHTNGPVRIRFTPQGKDVRLTGIELRVM